MKVNIESISYPKNQNAVVFSCKSLDWTSSFDAPIDDNVYTFRFDWGDTGHRNYLLAVLRKKCKLHTNIRETIDDLLGKDVFFNDSFIWSKEGKA